MKPGASKQLSHKSNAKHYRLIEPFVQIANLLPWSIRNGERCVQVAGRTLSERELPSADAIRVLSQSPVQQTLLKDLRRDARRRSETALMGDLLDMIPTVFQQRIFKALHHRLLQRFPQGRIEIGERTWNLAGNPLKVYRVYAAVREALDAIAAPHWQLGNLHVATLALPLPVRWVEIVWDHQQPAIRFVPDIVLDGLREALTGLDPRRIKRCPECGAFFLAWRLDKSACSPRCLNLARVHRHRAKQKDYEYHRKLRNAGVAKPERPRKDKPSGRA